MRNGRRWTPEDDARLVALRAAGEGYAAIAGALGRTGAAVQLRAVRLGCGEAKPHGAYCPWRAEEDAILVARRAEGAPFRAIATELRRSVDVVRARAHDLGLPTNPGRRAPRGGGDRRPRRCLTCGTTFASAGPGNRICPPCGPFTAGTIDVSYATPGLAARGFGGLG